MILTIAPASIPEALIPIASVVDVLGVDAEQVNAWCSSGKLRAVGYLGCWWVSVGDLTDFVERSSWSFVAPPPDKPRPGRGRQQKTP